MRRAINMRSACCLLVGCLFAWACDGGKPLVCTSNEVLTTDGNRQLTCRPAPAGAITPPYCESILTSDGRQLSCTSRSASADKDADIRSAIAQVNIDLNGIERQIREKTPPAAASYVGVTTGTTSGRIQSGVLQGLTAAAALCATQFGDGAHMCMLDELYQSVVNGTLGPANTIPKSWVYMPNWRPPLAGAEQPEQGVGDNCQGYTYPLGARRWVGVAAEWRPLPDGTPGFRWHSGSEGSCTMTLPIACCK